MNIIIKGKVVHGNKIGSSIGFPTINIPIDPIINIQNGVYYVSIIIDGFNYKGMANVGYKPTITSDKNRALEVHLFDYTGDAYEKQVTVKLLAFIRDEIKFKNIEELKIAIKNDFNTIKNTLC